MEGDKLNSIINPQSTPIRLRKVERELKRIKQGPVFGSSSGGGGGPHGPNRDSGVPIPTAEDISIVVTKNYTPDKIYQPGISIGIAGSYASVQGFDGYDYEFTNGGSTILDSHHVVDAITVLPSFSARNLPVPQTTASDNWTVRIRCRNAIYGSGEWSDPIPFNIAPGSTIAPGGRSNAITGTGANTVQVTFTLPDPVDLPNYQTTEIWIGTTSTFTELTGTLLGTNNKGIFQFTPDVLGGLSGLNNLYIRIRDIDTSGVPSPFGVATQITSTEVNEAQHYPIGFGTNLFADIKLGADIHGHDGVLIDAHGLVGGNPVPFEVDASGDITLQTRDAGILLKAEAGTVANIYGSGGSSAALTADGTNTSGDAFKANGFGTGGDDLRVTTNGDVIVGHAVRTGASPKGLLWIPLLPETLTGSMESNDSFAASVGVKNISGKFMVKWAGTWYQLGQILGHNDVEDVLDDGHSPIVVDNSIPSTPVIGHDVSGVTSGPYVLTSITIDDYGHATVIGSGSVTSGTNPPIYMDNSDPANPIINHSPNISGDSWYRLASFHVDDWGHVLEALSGIGGVDIDDTNSPYALDPNTTNYVTCDTTGGAITINMPDANGINNGCIAIISNMGPSTDVTISAAFGDNIDGRGSNIVKAGCTSIYVSYSGASPYRGWHSVGFDMLLGSNNLGDVAVPATARANLGLGTSAIHPVGDFAQTANNLSDLASASTARTNLGLGTAATKDIPASGDASSSQVVYGTDTRLTNSRTPTTHASTHLPGGSDALTVAAPVDFGTSNSQGSAASFARSDHQHRGTVVVKKSGSAVGTRNAVNFSTDFTVTDNGISDRVDVSLSAIQKYDTIQDEGSALTQRAKANFVGNGVSAADDSGNTATKIVVPGISTGTYAATRTGEVSGELYFPNDSIFVERFDGTNHVPWGPTLPLTKPLSPASWTWDNQISGTTIDETRGGVILNCTTTASTSVHTIYKTANSTPWSWIVGFVSHGAINNSMSAGIALRDSAGKIIYCNWTMNGNFQVDRWTNSTTFSINSKTDGMGLGATFGPHFLKVLDDGTNLKYYMSFDWGQHWTQRFSESRTAFFASGPTQIGYAVNNSNNSEPLYAWFFHVKEGTS